MLAIAKGYRRMNAQLTVLMTLIIVAMLGVSTFEILYFNVLHILVFVVSGSLRDTDKKTTLTE
ncbi:hypothetical protein OL548_13030 [Lysinibacillus sp. MHQ-1]|nr:hypothetical protein OL548_13030 [Lysinibacillus sp. MHQ-1]